MCTACSPERLVSPWLRAWYRCLCVPGPLTHAVRWGLAPTSTPMLRAVLLAAVGVTRGILQISLTLHCPPCFEVLPCRIGGKLGGGARKHTYELRYCSKFALRKILHTGTHRQVPLCFPGASEAVSTAPKDLNVMQVRFPCRKRCKCRKRRRLPAGSTHPGPARRPDVPKILYTAHPSGGVPRVSCRMAWVGRCAPSNSQKCTLASCAAGRARASLGVL